MKVPSFINIAQQDGIKLSDISVKGYGEDGLDLGGCWGNVSIAMIGKTGVCKEKEGMRMRYYWFDEEGEYEPGWYDLDENPLKNDESVLGNADEIIFDVGQGFVVYSDTDTVGCTLECAGQVFQAKLDYPLTTDGQNYVGNPNPVAVKLSDITVSGYGEDGLDLGGCWGNVSIAMIGKTGVCKEKEGMRMRYYWFDEEGEYEAGWYDLDENPLTNDESVLGNADEIEFAAGQGLVVYCDSDTVGCTINFPAVNIVK